MTRRMQISGVCSCCGRVGATWECVERTADGYVTVDDERVDLPALCDTCEYAQRRWDAAESCRRNPALGYPYAEGPPQSPPVRR